MPVRSQDGRCGSSRPRKHRRSVEEEPKKNRGRAEEASRKSRRRTEEMPRRDRDCGTMGLEDSGTRSPNYRNPRIEAERPQRAQSSQGFSASALCAPCALSRLSGVPKVPACTGVWAHRGAWDWVSGFGWTTVPESPSPRVPWSCGPHPRASVCPRLVPGSFPTFLRCFLGVFGAS